MLLAVPFSLVGAFWLLYLLGYNMSVAVWVGLIALAGLDAETGVVMLLYLDHAWEKFRAAGRMNSHGRSARRGHRRRGAAHPPEDHDRLRHPVRPAAHHVVARRRRAGADVMKRIAAPMIGGVITTAILELLIYPVIYVIWRRGAAWQIRSKKKRL